LTNKAAKERKEQLAMIAGTKAQLS
jgi:hypothetical protein